MAILDELIKNNEFPIIFVGAGIPKRYMESYPSWKELLEKIWKDIEKDKDFYSELSIIKSELKSQYKDDKELEFYVNTKIASDIEEKLREKFNSSEFIIKGLTSKDAYTKNINPLKKYISNIFENYTLIQNKEEEIKQFYQMLRKARTIITTNYDKFIEKTLEKETNDLLKKYIGPKGLFHSENGFSELYKIHGCSSDPNSIVITKDDYTEYENNSIIITSKIVHSLLNSPIIFIGYSLTDINIRTIIKKLALALDEKEKLKLKKRLIIINWKEGITEIIEETISDATLSCSFTQINTDNYLEIYKKIAKIDQGVTPDQISKFQHIIKELIVQKGKKGELDQTLVNLIGQEELSQLENIGEKNIAIALGDKAIVTRGLSVLDYLEDYFSEEKDVDLEVNLRFLAQQGISSAYPAIKYLTAENIQKFNCLNNERATLENRMTRLLQYTVIPNSYNHIIDIKMIKEIDKYLETIYSGKNILAVKDNIINSNIDSLEQEDVREYILKIIRKFITTKNGIIRTEFRKLMIKYDLKYNKLVLV